MPFPYGVSGEGHHDSLNSNTGCNQLECRCCQSKTNQIADRQNASDRFSDGLQTHCDCCCACERCFFEAEFGLGRGTAIDRRKKLTTTVATDDREVYVITSRIRGWVPKLGILFHTSVAICPQGVSPIVYENGNPVTNWKRCAVYGTQTNRTGFFREGKRVGVRATRIRGISATEIERRMRCHRQVNVPLFHDCRHHAINVTGLEGALFRRKLPVFLR